MRTRVLFLVTTLLFGLPGMSGIANSEPQQVPPRPVSKVTSLFSQEMPGKAVYSLHEERVTFSSAPYQTDWLAIGSVVGKRQVPLGEVIDVSQLSPDATGVEYAITSIYGLDLGRLQFSAGDDQDTIAKYEIELLPRSKRNSKFAVAQNIKLKIVEILPNRQETRIGPIEIPAQSQLTFGIGLLDILADATVNAPSRPILPSRKAPPVCFEIVVNGDAGESIVFKKTIPEAAATSGSYSWEEQSVDLSSFVGQTVQLSFRTDTACGEAAAAAKAWQPLWSSPRLKSSGSESTRPNLIVISLDTLRANHLGTYGYAKENSPNIDRFSEESFLFEKCISPSSWTTPSHATLFTGLPPSVHLAGMHQGIRLRSSFTTLSELAANHGYITAAFTEGAAVRNSLGFNQGFGQYSNSSRSWNIDENLAETTYGHARQWLDHYGDTPFFLFLHSYQIHTPYLAPIEYRSQYTSDTTSKGTPDAESRDPEHRKLMVDLYDSGIAYTDSVFGEFTRYLQERNLLENTIVLVVSDHGEEFWEHDGIYHAYTLYQEQLHVPFILRLPGKTPPSGRISEMIALSDAFATLVDLMGWEAEVPPSSINLTSLMNDASDSSSIRPGALSELWSPALKKYSVAWQTPEYKYILRTDTRLESSPLHNIGNVKDDERHHRAAFDLLIHAIQSKDNSSAPKAYEELLFHLGNDPQEQHSLTTSEPGKLEELRAQLEQALFGRIQNLATFQPGQAGEHEGLSEQEIEILKANGYLQ